MQAFMERVAAVEAEMAAGGAFVFGGALDDPEAARVINPADAGPNATAGPFSQSEEQIAGFYIINGDDLDAALGWASKVAEATNHPIEVRPFRATGRVES